jgi:uncharacterized membrane protein
MPAAEKPQPAFTCVACGKEQPQENGTAVDTLHPWLTERFRHKHPEAPPDAVICRECLDKLRNEYYAEMLNEEVGSVGDLEKEVIAALRRGGLLTGHSSGGPIKKPTFGQRLADRIAVLGGSWAFIISFSLLLALWMAINTVVLGKKAFDPYPFILLNLALSTLAALQAPVIMMSQNRQEALDRRRSEMDYKVNLKAELQNRELLQMLDQITGQQRELLKRQARVSRSRASTQRASTPARRTRAAGSARSG